MNESEPKFKLAGTVGGSRGLVKYEQWRCSNCGRMLAEVDIKEGSIKKICERCRAINILRREHDK